ncbi:MAG: hypothetical protein LBP63_06460 [Prevotellaceae bacterium]|jgi:hypothetical protein|nr:hypothetical protein [Prevotellaceae bacterium]
MKLYDFNTVFHFGIYKGETLIDIFEDDPDYIVWCIIHLDHFLISEDLITEMQLINPNFTLSPEAQDILNEKQEEYNEYDGYNEYDRYEDELPEPFKNGMCEYADNCYACPYAIDCFG